MKKLNGPIGQWQEQRKLGPVETPNRQLSPLSPVSAGDETGKEARIDFRDLRSLINDKVIGDEKGQKALLTALSFTSMVGLTWFVLNGPVVPIGVQSNIISIIWICLLYFFFQVFDLLLTSVVRVFAKSKVQTSFVLEFFKFFFTFSLTTAVTLELFRGGFNKAWATAGIWFLTSNAVIAVFAAIIFYRFRLMKELTLKSRVAQAEAQYSLLESQMQPHFLFNSLNVLSELIYVDPDLANSMSQKLADLYREILHNSKSKYSTLGSELSILQKYLEVQKIRFGERVRFHMDMNPAYEELKVPSLMLQTLVENAIKHGLAPRKEGGDIYFDIERVGNLFEITISNTGELYKGHKSTKGGTGLQNTKNRLDLMYGDKHNFIIFSDNKRTYVKFRITGRSS